MTLAALARRISDEQHVNVTWTDKAGNDYTIYDGDVLTLKRRVPDCADVHVLEMNVTDGVLWIGLTFAQNSFLEWVLGRIFDNERSAT